MENLELSPAVAGIGPSLHRSLSDLHRVQRRAIRSRSPLPPLPAPKGEVLRLVRQHDRISVRAVADHLRLEPTLTSTVIGELVDDGYLICTHDVDAPDVVRLRLRSKARARLGVWRDQGGHILDNALTSLTPQERAQLVRALPALAHLTAALEGLE
jgi:DNA-binding MarR family transcriptional regulator